jgi:peptide/nickel transport system substrate-binding protein
MKKLVIAFAISLVLVLSLGAQAKNGPIVDKVIFTVTMDRTIGTKDVVEGKADVFTETLSGSNYKSISAADLTKLSTYFAPGTQWEITFNPYPNAAPYQVNTKDGKNYFNPFAIREVRYAMNWLIDRKKIVDEILLGQGVPMITAMTPGQPGTYKFNLVPAKLGMTFRGNEKKAIDDITAAMTAASNLPENKGKLVKNGQWWTFNGDPVAINFMMRVDDPSGRLLEGRYISDQIEKAGIKVNRLEWDRTKCINTQTATDPADYLWNIYTGGWGGGGTREWWDVSISQMYSPYYSNMPGWGETGYWQFQDKALDDIAKKNINGWFVTADEYWTGNMKAIEMGLKDAVRMYVASSQTAQISNKARFNSRMAYGLGDGLNNWSIRTADVKPEADGPNKGLKVLHALEYSARGGLYMSAWDPVGVDGFNGTYEAIIIENCSDLAAFNSPNSAKLTPLRAKYDLKNLTTSVKAVPNDKPAGLIPVDKTAVIYDSHKKAWVTGEEYKDDGKGKVDYSANANLTAYSKLSNVSYVGGKWHDGNKIGIEDLMYATAFQYEWANKDSADDKMYDESIASQYQSLLPITKGIVLNKDGSYNLFFDFNWMDKSYIAGSGALQLDVKAANPGRQTVVEWPITEALAKIVVEGSKSGEVYSFSSDGASTEVDVIVQKCVGDIKAKLQDMIAAKYVPVSIKQWVTADQAVARYKNAIAFIEKYGHAYISNGPFFISKIDNVSNSIELTANRDYPIKSDWLPKLLATTITRIDDVKVPATAQRSKDTKIAVTVSAVSYPNDIAKAADAKAKVTVTMVMPDNSEKVYTAKFVKDGAFEATLPAKDLGSLKPGNYTLVVQSVLADEAPAVTPSSLVLF